MVPQRARDTWRNGIASFATARSEPSPTIVSWTCTWTA